MGIKQKIKNLIMLTKEEKLIPVPTQVNINRLLEEKVALVVGGTGGIGKSIAKAYLNSGAKVVITGTSENKVNDGIKNIDVGGVLRCKAFSLI